MPTPRTFEKVNRSDKNKHVKKWLKNATKKNIVKSPFWGTSKNRNWIQKYVQISHGFLLSKMVLKSVIA